MRNSSPKWRSVQHHRGSCYRTLQEVHALGHTSQQRGLLFGQKCSALAVAALASGPHKWLGLSAAQRFSLGVWVDIYYKTQPENFVSVGQTFSENLTSNRGFIM